MSDDHARARRCRAVAQREGRPYVIRLRVGATENDCIHYVAEADIALDATGRVFKHRDERLVGGRLPHEVERTAELVPPMSGGPIG